MLAMEALLEGMGLAFASDGMRALSRYLQSAEEEDEDDVHLVRSGRRRNADFFTQRADVVNAVVAGRVNLDDIKRCIDVSQAVVAFVARDGIVLVRTVERPRQEARRTRFADTARPQKQISMAGLPVRQRRFKRAGYMLLPDQLVERCAAVFTI